ncbi:SDR family NAD(P)-dependent oxidoreductase [Affinirhizobium pseudoryzae]|jgi:NAD(P)-dependent dehydrogenase (short-subunit alcohol dehydrogenase family)|uniref:SDR family NAD(P)-dependent oxidoreductase n=1 Tax=Allorhizobium pseudoryzae TaxID=379684 RepID=UPI0013EB1BE7|nr:SDR family NAD(P)-dependent oxidoreductase [Allorhizobium pseudoryzae]
MKKTFLMTGASKGIGLALANRLLAHGATVIGIAHHADDDVPGSLHLVTSKSASTRPLK